MQPGQWPVTTASYFVFVVLLFTEDKMNAFAGTLFCRLDHIPSFANSRKRNKKRLWLRRDHNYFLHVQTEAAREEGTELWCDIRISPCVCQTDSGKEYTCRMSISCLKKQPKLMARCH